MTVTTMSSIWYSAKYPVAGQKQRKDRDRPDALISLTVSRRAIAADLETVRSRSSVKAAMPHQRGAWVPSRAILRTIKVIFPTSCPVSSLVRRRTRDASPACGRSNLPASFPRQAGERQALEVVVPLARYTRRLRQAQEATAARRPSRRRPHAPLGHRPARAAADAAHRRVARAAAPRAPRRGRHRAAAPAARAGPGAGRGRGPGRGVRRAAARPRPRAPRALAGAGPGRPAAGVPGLRRAAGHGRGGGAGGGDAAVEQRAG